MPLKVFFAESIFMLQMYHNSLFLKGTPLCSDVNTVNAAMASVKCFTYIR